MISQHAFKAVTAMFHSVSGIQLVDAKRALVSGRLARMAQERGFNDVDSYVDTLLANNDPRELEQVVDKLTTNETYFFREPEHFDHLNGVLDQWIADKRHTSEIFRVWSAASSSGEEAYTIAMVLAEKLGFKGWEIVGSDLSTAMVESARTGLYPLERAKNVPLRLLKKYCLKGDGKYEGQLLISRELRDRVRFGQANLMQDLPRIGEFDVIFLRNVLIYFDPPAKAEIVQRVMTKLKPGGLLYTGHAESLTGLAIPIRSVGSAIYEPA
jgi:chemotaxis protein methyltransferase CheR